MFQLRQILFPVDFSRRCRGAAAYVQSLAGRFDAELILFHVIEATYNSSLELHGQRPVDFTRRCRGAAAYVQSLAGRFDAELILFHVIEATYNSSLELHGQRPVAFESFFDKSLRHLKVKTLVEHGDPAQKIIQCASTNHVDLIMIPTQGMGIYRRLILGSTSAKVLHDADCPVWTGVHLEDAHPWKRSRASGF